MKKALFFLGFIFCFSLIYSQSSDVNVIASSGDYVEGTGYSVSWTLGEIAIESLSDGNVSVNQGFQQAYYSVTTLEEINNTNFFIDVFPNPSTDLLHIKYSADIFETYILELYDIKGTLILNKEVQSCDELLNMESMARGEYFIKTLKSDGALIKSFKIIKN